MSLSKYQVDAARREWEDDTSGDEYDFLEAFDNFVYNISSPRVLTLGSTYAALGLAGESGEVADRVKKILRDERSPTKDDLEYLKLELGDVLWYWCRMAQSLGLSPQSIITANVDKLLNRHSG